MSTLPRALELRSGIRSFTFPASAWRNLADALESKSTVMLGSDAAVAVLLPIFECPAPALQDRARIVFDCRMANDPDMMPSTIMASRKHPPHRNENRFWKAGYAWLSFQYVVDLCDYILSEKIQPEATIYYPLVTAISVLYARPFKRSKGIESLTLQFVPKKFLYLHRQLILIRDQTAAHVDAHGAQFKELPANNVRLIVRGSQVALSVQQVKFKLSGISQIRELASAL